MESIPPYWEAARQMFYQRIGNPTTPDGKAMLVERSLLTSAGKIKTPLMTAQGANDTCVNHAESEQIVVALRDRGFPVEYLLIPDEGHGFARPSAGINRHAVGNERVLQGRSSEPPDLQSCGGGREAAAEA